MCPSPTLLSELFSPYLWFIWTWDLPHLNSSPLWAFHVLCWDSGFPTVVLSELLI